VLDGDGLVAAVSAAGLPITNSAANFLTAIEQGRPPAPDFREALAAHRIVDAIYRSAEAGGVPVAVDRG
jgi:predicted dehydrogenase